MKYKNEGPSMFTDIPAIATVDLVTRNNMTPHCFNLKPKRYSEFSLFRV